MDNRSVWERQKDWIVTHFAVPPTTVTYGLVNAAIQLAKNEESYGNVPGSGKCRLKHGLVRAIICHAASSSNTSVSRAKKQRNSACTKLRERVAHASGIVSRYCLLGVGVACGEGLWRVGLVQHILNPIQVPEAYCT